MITKHFPPSRRHVFRFLLVFFLKCVLWAALGFAAAHGLSSGCREQRLPLAVGPWLLLLQSTGSRVLALQNMGLVVLSVWRLPGPGSQPVSPALAGRCSATSLVDPWLRLFTPLTLKVGCFRAGAVLYFPRVSQTCSVRVSYNRGL